MAAADICDHLRNKERIETGGPVSTRIIEGFILKSFEASDTAAPDHPDLIFIGVALLQSAVLHRLNTRCDAVLREGIQFPDFFFFEILFRFEAFYFACKPGFKTRGIESGYQRCTAYSVNQVF